MLTNIKTALEKMDVVIRMNIDARNKHRIRDLLDRLDQESLVRKPEFYLGYTYPITPVCKDIAGRCLEAEDFFHLDLQTSLDMADRGFEAYQPPRSVETPCGAVLENSYVVSPSGRLGKCWNEVENAGTATGHVLRPETDRMKRNAGDWLAQSPFELECRHCLFLPVCMGGCAYLYRKEGKVRCPGWKYRPELYLQHYYFRKKREQEAVFGREFREFVKGLKKSADFPPY